MAGTFEGRPLPDAPARAFAVDPAENVVLEASAGTGKTSVLVERYVNLLRAGVDPEHILAITFTRKAAAEMRQRIIARLKEASRGCSLDAARWRDLRGRLGDIAVSTIDAFCLALLREFPLEAQVDPSFDLADDTEVARLVDESLDRTLRLCRGLARTDDRVALVFAQLGERRIRAGLAALLDRRLTAPDVLRRYLAGTPRTLTAEDACRRAARRIADALAAVPGGLDRFLRDGPIRHPQFALLAEDMACAVRAWGREREETTRGDLADLATCGGQAAFRAFVDRLRAYFLTQKGRPRGERFAGTGFTAAACESSAAWRRHRAAAAAVAPAVAEAVAGFRRDLNVLLARGVWRMLRLAIAQYERLLEARSVLDFAGVLERAVELLGQMDEFARSRYRLEARYRHVLVDEFQDTSRVQWRLVEQLVRSWGEGLGASADALPPSIFIVGDRKQSIYGFRDADVALLDEAVRFVAGLRPPGARTAPSAEDAGPRRAISVSFRSAPEILAFVNDVFTTLDREQPGGLDRPYAFSYRSDDRFPLIGSGGGEAAGGSSGEPALGLVAGPTMASVAAAVAREIEEIVARATVRDRAAGVSRAARPGDIAILFRARDSHRAFEAALERCGLPTYVYKGLGFFEADEIQDAMALLRYLADPTSNLRAAAFLRSRFVRLSDRAVLALAPDVSGAVLGAGPGADRAATLEPDDRLVLARTRESVARWLPLVDLVSPSELVDLALRESAYYYEIRGPRRLQARENLKKLRGIIRRLQNRGYPTLSRIADHLDRLAAGDESNAAVDALDAVSLMTVHAAKGLEFPVVFVVNVNRGAGGARAPIRIATSSAGAPSVAVADFQSEADQEVEAREREETKRLLYVALTRARDRLYLAATVPGGVCQMGRGSLGEALPSAFAGLFAAAAAAAGSPRTLDWAPVPGAAHRFRAVSGA